MGNQFTILNSLEKFETKKIGNASQVATELNKLIMSIYVEFVSEDGTGVDYKNMGKSEGFRGYLEKLKELHFVSIYLQQKLFPNVSFLSKINLDELPEREKLCFFINLYKTFNTLPLHTTSITLILSDTTCSSYTLRLLWEDIQPLFQRRGTCGVVTLTRSLLTCSHWTTLSMEF